MPYIYFAENSDIVEIKPSKLTNAGDGLFATKSIKKDEFICWYSGVYLSKEFIENGYYESDYLFQPRGRNKLVIDASDPNSCYGRYINDSLSKMKKNSDFESYADTHSAAIIATKNIRKGSEIYISYGNNFWREPRLYNKLSVADKQHVDDDDT